MLTLHRARGRAASARGPAGAAILAGLLLIAPAPSANAYSERVNAACRDDYFQFCAGYLVESIELRRCMEAYRRTLSRACVDALVAAGEVPKKYLKLIKR
jgi:hypothetical protein